MVLSWTLFACLFVFYMILHTRHTLYHWARNSAHSLHFILRWGFTKLPQLASNVESFWVAGTTGLSAKSRTWPFLKYFWNLSRIWLVKTELGPHMESHSWMSEGHRKLGRQQWNVYEHSTTKNSQTSSKWVSGCTHRRAWRHTCLRALPQTLGSASGCFTLWIM